MGWILAADWMPYQLGTFVTPAFPGYPSGHSSFSRAAAEVLTAMTGSPFFPGGLGTFVAPSDHFLRFEAGPSQDVVLQWATYYDAADQAGISRRFGGIHPFFDDYTSRIVGSQLGTRAWARSLTFHTGGAPAVVPAGPRGAPLVAATLLGVGLLALRARRRASR